MKISNEIEVEATKELLEYCKNNLVLNNPEYITKQKMGLWLGKTPEKLHLYKINGNKLILPFGTVRDIWDICVNEEKGWDIVFNKIDIKSKNNIELYDYQKEAVKKIVEGKNGVFISPAGSGKTTIAVEVIKELTQKTLFLTHTIDLLKQAKKRMKENYDCSIGEISAGKVNIQDVTFATIQTMCNLNIDEYSREFGCVVIDECHRISGTPTKLTMFYKVISQLKAPYKIGLTATAHRADGLMQGVYALIGNVIHEVSKEAVSNKTTKASVTQIYTDMELERYGDSYNTDGTINFSAMITEIANNEKRNRLICEHINENESTLVLSDRITQLKELCKNSGFGKVVTGKTKKKEREKILEHMREGKEKILYASYSLAKEGLDIPCLQKLILATPKKDKAVIIQSVGRIERKHKGKEKATVYDIVDKNISICRNMSVCRNRIYKNNNNLIY